MNGEEASEKAAETVKVTSSNVLKMRKLSFLIEKDVN